VSWRCFRSVERRSPDRPGGRGAEWPIGPGRSSPMAGNAGDDPRVDDTAAVGAQRNRTIHGSGVRSCPALPRHELIPHPWPR
jgi:hypothetical protein